MDGRREFGKDIDSRHLHQLTHLLYCEFNLTAGYKFAREAFSQDSCFRPKFFIDPKTLEQAYADDLGVTAAFNLNILRSINAIIDSNFDVSDFCHKVVVNQSLERVELYLPLSVDPKAARRARARPAR